MKYTVFIVPLWGTLGFYRGNQFYNFTYKKRCIEFEKNKKVNKQYFYSFYIGYGVLSSLIYLNPFLLPLIANKEFYRLEINILGLHEEKEKEYFYTLI